MVKLTLIWLESRKRTFRKLYYCLHLKSSVWWRRNVQIWCNSRTLAIYGGCSGTEKFSQYPGRNSWSEENFRCEEYVQVVSDTEILFCNLHEVSQTTKSSIDYDSRQCTGSMITEKISHNERETSYRNSISLVSQPANSSNSNIKDFGFLRAIYSQQ